MSPEDEFIEVAAKLISTDPQQALSGFGALTVAAAQAMVQAVGGDPDEEIELEGQPGSRLGRKIIIHAKEPT